MSSDRPADPRSLAGLAGVLIAAALTGAPGLAGAAPVSFSLDVSPPGGGVGETFTATVELDIPGGRSPDRFDPPDFPGFTVVDSQLNQTTSVDINPNTGQRQLRTIELRRFLVRADDLGHHVLGPARAVIDGQEYESNQVSVEVVPRALVAGDPDPTAAGGIGAPGYRRPSGVGHPDMFLHVAVDRTAPWVGEQVTVTWLLFAREDVARLQPEPPRLDDLWSEKIYDFDTDLRYHEEYVDGERYLVAILSKRALFPTRSGRVEVRPYRAKAAIGYSPDLVELASPTVTLDVKALPGGAPPGFDPTWVGQWSVEAEVDRNQIDAGDGVTLTVRVRGTGAVGRLATPPLQAAGFRLRAPRDREQRVDSSSGIVRGEVVLRYWVMPERGGAQTLPPLRVSYFDPRSGQYQVASSQPITLMVRGDPAAAGADPGDHFIAPDIRLIHDGTAIASVSAAPVHRRLWFWLLAALAPLGYVGLLVWQRLRGGDAGRRRGRGRHHLRQADVHLRGNRPVELFGELARVVHEHVEQAVGQSVRALTRDQVAGLLRERGFSDQLIARIADELDNCDFARYAPAASAPEEMRAAMERTRVLAADIDRAAAEAVSAADEVTG